MKTLTSILCLSLAMPVTAQLYDRNDQPSDKTTRDEIIEIEDRSAPFTPTIAGELYFELRNDYNYDSDDGDNIHNQLYGRPEIALSANILPGLNIVGVGVMEPVEDPQAGEDRVFEDQGLFLEEIYAEYEHPVSFGEIDLKAGKFNIDFGRGWDVAPGVYGALYLEDGYEVTERIGGEIELEFETKNFGEHEVKFATFYADNTTLTDSIIESRGQTDGNDGGPSNTEDFSSFAVALNGEVPGIGDLEYHLGYIKQAGGEGDTGDERGYAAALMYSMPISENTVLNPFVEYVYQDEAGADENTDINHFTVALEAVQGPWNAAAVYSIRDINVDGGDDADDNQFQLSAGYQFDSGLTLDVGWKIGEESDVETQTVGALATYAIEF